VHSNQGRYQAKCDTPPCRKNHLGTFNILEEAAQTYLQHYQKEHPEQLKKERAPPLQVQQHLLIRSDKGKAGYKGVYRHKGRYMATCNTSHCCHNNLGSFGTPEEAAQAYLQHQQHSHNHQTDPPPCLKDEGRHGWLRMFNALHDKEQQQQPLVGDRISVHWPEEGQWFSGHVFEVSEDDSSYCVVYDDGDKQWHSWQGDGAPDWRVDAGKVLFDHAVVCSVHCAFLLFWSTVIENIVVMLSIVSNLHFQCHFEQVVDWQVRWDLSVCMACVDA
jgi:hypothetical protein